MNRKILVIIIIIFLIGTGAWLLWPKNEVVTPLPVPTNPVFTPSFLPSPSPSPPPIGNKEPINVSIVSIPQGAEITVNDQVIGNAPLRYAFETLTHYHITATKSGFAPLVIDFTPTDQTLRLQLVALNTLPTSTARPNQTSSPTATLPTAVAVPFPEQYSLNNHTLPTQEYTYTTSPKASSSANPIPQTTKVPVAVSTTVNTNKPSEAEIQVYESIINRYTGVYATDPNDAVEQGTANENVIIVSDKYFYPNPIEVFVAFKPRFVNITNTTCTLRALTDQGNSLSIGTLAPNQDLIFTPSDDIDGTWQFWCQERSNVISTIQFFS